MSNAVPRIDNAPYLSLVHGGFTIQGWSRAGVQSYWRIPELRLGFDLGASPWDFLHTQTIFISHPHLDHLAALPTFLARRAMMKLPPPTIYVPNEIVPDVQHLLEIWQRLDRGKLNCSLIGVSAGSSTALSAEHFVTSFATQHPVVSLGYVVWERRRKLRLEFQGMSGEQLKQLRQDGIAVTEELAVPLICYTGDTGPEGLESEPAIYLAKILIVEMSFARPDQSRATIHRFGHLHLEDFVDRAEKFRNELIIAAHITTRDDPAEVKQLAKGRLPKGLFDRMVFWGET